MIQYDPPLRTVKRDDETIVLSCTDCGHVWRALTFGRIEAYKSAERHQTITHGIEQNVAETPRRMFESRQRSSSAVRAWVADMQPAIERAAREARRAEAAAFAPRHAADTP